MKSNLDQSVQNNKPHLSQVEKLDRLISSNFDDSTGLGPWIPLPEVMALGIAAYSRRFEDLRRIYGEDYGIENKTERGLDGITRSWYRKFRKERWQDRPRVATNSKGQALAPFELVP